MNASTIKDNLQAGRMLVRWLPTFAVATELGSALYENDGEAWQADHLCAEKATSYLGEADLTTAQLGHLAVQLNSFMTFARNVNTNDGRFNCANWEEWRMVSRSLLVAHEDSDGEPATKLLAILVQLANQLRHHPIAIGDANDWMPELGETPCVYGHLLCIMVAGREPDDDDKRMVANGHHRSWNRMARDIDELLHGRRARAESHRVVACFAVAYGAVCILKTMLSRCKACRAVSCGEILVCTNREMAV